MDTDTLIALETLCAELRAIEHWDTAYLRNKKTEKYEASAFLARRERRSEIIRQLVVLRRACRRRKTPQSYITSGPPLKESSPKGKTEIRCR